MFDAPIVRQAESTISALKRKIRRNIPDADHSLRPRTFHIDFQEPFVHPYRIGPEGGMVFFLGARRFWPDTGLGDHGAGANVKPCTMQRADGHAVLDFGKQRTANVCANCVKGKNLPINLCEQHGPACKPGVYRIATLKHLRGYRHRAISQVYIAPF